MKISSTMVAEYLGIISSVAPDNQDEPLEDMEQYHDGIDSMATFAQRKGDLEALKLGMESLIAQPEGRMGPFESEVYPFEHEELAELFGYAFRRLWPGEEPRGEEELPDITLVAMSAEEWEAERARS